MAYGDKVAEKLVVVSETKAFSFAVVLNRGKKYLAVQKRWRRRDDLPGEWNYGKGAWIDADVIDEAKKAFDEMVDLIKEEEDA